MTTVTQRLNDALTTLEGHNTTYADKIGTLDGAIQTANDHRLNASNSAKAAANSAAEAAASSGIPSGGSTGQVLTRTDDSSAWQAIPTPPNATTTAAGLVELATNTEAETGTDTSLAVTPAGVAAAIAAIPAQPLASDTTAGLLRLATDTEFADRTDVNAAVTPDQIPEVSKGTGWQVIDGVLYCWGSQNMSFNSSFSTITFPRAFSSAPVVNVTISMSNAVSGAIAPLVRNITNSNFQAAGDHSNATGSGTLYWFAVGVD